jgi:thiol:disulfide interchange protein
MPERMTPDMTGKASEITEPLKLFARIGYPTYLAWRDGDQSPSSLYEGFIVTELRR